VTFPRDLDDWDEYIEKVFKEGNSHVFLKLAAWISCRFCELAGISKDDELNGLVIPKHPGWFTFDNHDHFLEALGMERLYAATVHMDTHPEYLACIFRQLGELESANEMGSSHPRLRPLPSPPTPVARYVICAHRSLTHTTISMMPAHELPWLLPFVHSTESDDVGDLIDHRVGNGTVKRKRTLSNATLTPQVSSSLGMIVDIDASFRLHVFSVGTCSCCETYQGWNSIYVTNAQQCDSCFEQRLRNGW
jgi:hypothetical protein